jgi:hypothetical protein
MAIKFTRLFQWQSLCRSCTVSLHCVGGGFPTLRSFFTPPTLTLSAPTASGSRKPQLTKRVAPASGSRVSARCVFVNNATTRAENVPQRQYSSMYSSLLNSGYGVPQAKCQDLLLIAYAICFICLFSVLLVSSLALLFFFSYLIFTIFLRFISIYPHFSSVSSSSSSLCLCVL